MDLEQLRALLTKAERFYQPEREPSIFALGGRGYYENPTTDLLAFFLDPAQVHGLEECFLTALLNCLPNTSTLTPSLRAAPSARWSPITATESTWCSPVMDGICSWKTRFSTGK